MKIKRKRILIVSALVITLLIGFLSFNKFLKPKAKTTKDLINISTLSKEFMDNYFEEIKEINSSDNQDNILIVISETKITDGYGASKIVASPNNQYVLQYNSKEEKNSALEKFKKDDSIMSVEENMRYELDETYNSWGITKMSLDYAIQTAESRDLNDVVVAIIDTGCNVTLANQYYEGKIIETYNLIDENVPMTDEAGHGTHVFGTIAEGTPSNVKILPIKVGDSDGLYTAAILTAINYITYNEKADVINMSFGGGSSTSERQAIEAANEKNIISVASAGNSNTSANHYPSGYDSTIAISSVDSNLNKSYFSNYGSAIDFAAPGSSIKSINGTKSGTSMATPHAVSAVAILKSYNKDLTLDQVKSLLRKHAIDLGSEGKDQYYGYGFITFINAKFCEGPNDDCDEYGVFKTEDAPELEITKIEPGASTGYYIPYNYNNITSLMNNSIKIYFNDDLYITKQLGDLDGVEITNYDPSILYDSNTEQGKQTVTISYRGKSTTVDVMNCYGETSDWSYEVVEGNNIKLTGINYGNVSSYFPKTIYIPDQIDGYTVTELGDSLFENKTQLRRVFLSQTITTIGNSVFQGCDYLSNVDLSTNVQTIGNYAFKDTNLESVEFNNSLTSIGDHAFENTMITTVSIPKNVNHIGYYVFAGCDNITNIVVDSQNTTYDSRNNSNMIIETETDTLIKGYYGHTIPSSVKIIGEGAYYGDSNLYNIAIPDGVTTIDYYAFRHDGVSNLSTIVIPRSVTTINYAFNSGNRKVLIQTYSDAYAKTYAIANSLCYTTMDINTATAILTNFEYQALSTVSGNIRIQANYEKGYYSNNTYYSGETKIVTLFDNNVTSLNSRGFTLTYPDNRNYLIYGDTYVTVTGKDNYNNNLEATALVIVSKITPEYTVPTNLQASLGSTLNDVVLPSGFEWMDDTQVLNEVGEHTFKARYVPVDTTNYETKENIDITVNVIEEHYTIKFNSNGGTGSIGDQTAVYNQDVNITKNTFERAGYKFVSWNTASNGSGNEYLDQASVRNLTDPDGEITLYAQWDPIGYTIRFNSNTGSGEMNDINTNYDSEVTLTKNTFTKANYTFMGWATTNDGAVAYQDEQKVSNLTAEDEAVITLYAVWQENGKHTITFHSNYGTETTTSQSVYDGTNTNLIGNTFSRLGYTFNNWNTSSDGSGTPYTDEQQVSITNNLDLYAQWSPIQYTIRFNSNGGTGSMSDLTVEYDQEVTLTKNTFTKENYNFMGWATTSDGEVAYTNEQKVSNLTAEEQVINLYAVWETLPDDLYNLTQYILVGTDTLTNISEETSVYDYEENLGICSSCRVEVYDKNDHQLNYNELVGTGSTTKIYKGNELQIEFTNVVLGDTNGDGKVLGTDARKIALYTIGVSELTDIEKLAADVTSDNDVTGTDARRIALYVIGVPGYEVLKKEN